jgi:hypothetical protein
MLYPTQPDAGVLAKLPNPNPFHCESW